MLDPTLMEQLRSVLSTIEGEILLRYRRSSHPDQVALVEMLASLADASGKIRMEESADPSEAPFVELVANGRATGISFRGVPGGHEFSSLVLSILYADGKGKRPDAGITGRIERLRGPIRLTTYVSLSCEVCPEVVQGLNLIASIHADFRAETVDGAVAPGEIERLGVAGVPAVFAGDRLIHSGKTDLPSLIVKLETLFGTSAGKETGAFLGDFDVAVIGGGPAGVAAAVYAARKGLRTAVVAERFGGQLKDTKGIENMISIPHIEGAELAGKLREHLSSYPISLFEHRRVRKISGDGIRRLEIDGGETLNARALIVATGAQWRRLGIPGEAERIGRGVAFCAHCDGPFFKGKRVAVIGGGNSGVEAALDLAGTSREVVLIEYEERLRADQLLVEKLKALPNASILTGTKTTRIVGDADRVTALELIDRKSGESRTLPTDGIFVQIGLKPNSEPVADIARLTPHGEIEVDPHGRTSAPGIYAAGDVTTLPFKQIVTAMGDGAKTALTVFSDLRLKGENHGT